MNQGWPLKDFEVMINIHNTIANKFLGNVDIYVMLLDNAKKILLIKKYLIIAFLIP